MMKSVPRPLIPLCALLLSIAPAHAQDTPQEREAELKREWQKSQNPETAVQLAFVREELGKWTEALNTWGLIKTRWGHKTREYGSSAPQSTYGQLGTFFTRRIERRFNLQRHPVRLTSALRHKIGQAAQEFKQDPGVDQLDLSVQADLDGDAIDEILFKGSTGPNPGMRKPSTIGIAKWNGQKYQVVWQDKKRIPFMVHIADYDADGWKEVFCGYTPDTDDAATLLFNGTNALYY